MFAGKKSAQIREILISESAWEEMTCLFAPSLESGVLSIKYSKQKLHIDAADAMFEGICTDLSMHKWKPETIKKIRLLNVSLDQGFEIDAGGAECKKTGKMTFDEARAYRQGFIKPIP